MTIWKKALSVGTSAALLASLLITAAVPAAFGANTASAAVTIYPGYDPSAASSITFAEDAVDQWVNGSFTVAVYDNAGVDANATWSTTTAPTVVRNAGVGSASAGFVADTLVINVAGTDITKIDSFTVSGLKVRAGAAAAKGALIFDVTADTLGLSESLQTASGVLAAPVAVGDVAATVTLDAGSEGFQPSAVDCIGAALVSSKVTIAASGVSLAETFTAAAGTTGGAIAIAAPGFTGAHPADAVVTQSVCSARFPSFATVGDAVLVVNDEDTVNFQAGVNSQDAGTIHVDLGFFDGLLKKDDTVTFTIATAGVLFSPDSCVLGCMEGFGFVVPIGTPTLGAGRNSVTVAIKEDATAGDYLHFDPNYDVALTVPNGTVVEVGITVSRAGVVVLDSPVTVAVVGFVTAGSTAAPTIFIGQNDQATGMITIKESAAGVLTDDGLLEVCLQTDETWAVGRYFWAVVTVGDLKLNAAGLPVAQAKMTIDGDCLTVLPYTASTVASTIEIRDGTSTAPAASAPTAGPKVNVPNTMTPGQTYVRVYNDGFQVADNIVIAVRAYTGTPTAKASAQLPVVRGLLNQATGSITFTEGAPNQFGTRYDLDLCLVYPSVSDNNAWIWSNPVGANAPVVTTNSTVSGLIATFMPQWSDDECIDIRVDDTAFSGLGTITISNLKLDVKTDAPLGPVFVRIYTDDDINGETGPSLGAALQATVSPATVISQKALAIAAYSALGLKPAAGYTTKTPKYTTVGKYVTWKFAGGAALAGQRVNVLVASKVGGIWGPIKYLKSAWADANGIVTFAWKSNTAAWVNVRVQWPGSSTYSVSYSKSLAAVVR